MRRFLLSAALGLTVACTPTADTGEPTATDTGTADSDSADSGSPDDTDTEEPLDSADTSNPTDSGDDTGSGNPYPIPSFSTGWSDHTVAGLSARVYSPQAIAARGDGRSLLVVLHGCGQSASDLESYGQWLDAAEDHGMVVALPAVPNGGVYLGCWDYYGTQHSRSSGHIGSVVGLAQALANTEDLWIDADQVYVAGLSSGGGMAMLAGCVAPDVFAGTGIVAGPTVGTSATQISYVATTRSAAVATCKSLAGSNTSHFSTQVTSTLSGTSDHTVDQDYASLNAEVMADIYGASPAGTIDVASLPGNSSAGTGSLWSDGSGSRVSRIEATGLGHEWPAGGGTGYPFISSTNLDYAWYLGSFFNAHNTRAGSETWTE